MKAVKTERTTVNDRTCEILNPCGCSDNDSHKRDHKFFICFVILLHTADVSSAGNLDGVTVTFINRGSST